eukprot:13874559-Ditylum_brightwellii.AAC.1
MGGCGGCGMVEQTERTQHINLTHLLGGTNGMNPAHKFNSFTGHGDTALTTELFWLANQVSSYRADVEVAKGP